MVRMLVQVAYDIRYFLLIMTIFIYMIASSGTLFLILNNFNPFLKI